MHPARRLLPLLAALTVLTLTAACASPARTAANRIDDSVTTAAVKAKLAADRIATLTEIDVETHQGVVTLNGVVDDDALRQRAAYLAGQAHGVRAVVNNLTVRQAAVPAPPPVPPPASTPAPNPPVSTGQSDEWRVADTTLRGSADDLRNRAVREAAAQNRAVAYERVDGSRRVEAYPLSTPARDGCRWIQQRVFENGRLIDESSTEVCG
jgi:hyperosmotically inducible protein